MKGKGTKGTAATPLLTDAMAAPGKLGALEPSFLGSGRRETALARRRLKGTHTAVVAAYRRDLKRRHKLLVRLKSFDAEIVAGAVDCLNSRTAAALWLTRPQYSLNGLVPVEMKIIPRTKAEILHVLGRIEHGVF
jgi:hypothetical protein